MRAINICPACESGDAKLIVRLDADRMQKFIDFDRLKYGGLLGGWIDTVPPEVLGCGDCGHAWYHYQPTPEQLAIMYASAKPLHAAHAPTNASSAAMRNEMRRLHRLTRAASNQPALLDYGSGRGRWARAALEEGFRVVAYEPSIERGGEATPPFQLVHFEAELAGKRFDVIQLEQVLEHVADPLLTLTQLKEYCGDQAIVRITVPNILRDPEAPDIWKSWPFNGETPHVLAPFEHLQGFTPKSLERLCVRAGYRPISPRRILWTHPSNLLRRGLSTMWPRLGTTAQYLMLQS